MSWVFDSNSYFVDPAQADDTGDGTTEATAKKTIAAAISLVSAGDTLFLAGGLHTVATSTTVDLPDGVSVIGGGKTVTIIRGHTASITDPVLKVIGNSHLEGFSVEVISVGAGIGVTAAGGTELTIVGCRLLSQDGALQISNPTSGRHNISLTDCDLDLTNAYGIDLGSSPTDIVLTNCKSIGDANFIRGSTITNDQTIIIDNCAIQNINGVVDTVNMDTSSSGDVEISVINTSFLTSGQYFNLDAIGSGDITLFDNGGNNITNNELTLTNGSTIVAFSDIVTEEVWSAQKSSYTVAGTMGRALNDTSNGPRLLASGTSTAGSTTTLTIASSPGADNFYKGCLIVLTSGAGAEQARYIESHTDVARVVTFDRPLEIAAAASTGYAIYSAMSPEQIVTDTVWDDLHANRNVAGSIGKWIQDQELRTRILISDGTVDVGGSTSAQISGTGLNANDDYYIDCLVVFNGGTGAQQARFINDYNGSTPEIFWEQPLGIIVDATTTFKIYQVTGGKSDVTVLDKLPSVFLEGTSNSLAAPSTTTIDLGVFASSVDNIYNGSLIDFVSGTGVGQSSWITAYNGTTHIATFDVIQTAIDSTTGFKIFAIRTPDVNSIIAKLPNAGAKMAGEGATIKNLDQLPTTAEINTAVEDGQIGIDTNNIDANVTLTLADTTSIVSKLPRNTRKMAGEGLSSFDLDTVNTAPILSTEVDVTGTDTIFNLQSGETIDGYYIGYYLILTSGVLTGETLRISDYIGSTRTVTMSNNFSGIPQAGDKLDIYRVESNASAILDKLPSTGVNIAGEGITAKNLDSVLLAETQVATWLKKLATSAGAMVTSTATGGSVTTLIDTSLTAANDTYNGRIVMFLTGTLAGRVASITDYDLATTTLTISQVTTAPTNETYIII